MDQEKNLYVVDTSEEELEEQVEVPTQEETTKEETVQDHQPRTLQDLVQMIQRGHSERAKELQQAMFLSRANAGKKQAITKIVGVLSSINDTVSSTLMDLVALSQRVMQSSQQATEVGMHTQNLKEVLEDKGAVTEEELRNNWDALVERMKLQHEMDIAKMQLEAEKQQQVSETEDVGKCHGCQLLDTNKMRCGGDEDERRVDDWYTDGSSPDWCPMKQKDNDDE